MTTKTYAEIATTSALAGGQAADDALLVHHAAVAYDHAEMAEDKLRQYDAQIAYLYDMALTDAGTAGVTLDLLAEASNRCQRHGYYHWRACGICS
jgi:hypothetical protein